LPRASVSRSFVGDVEEAIAAYSKCLTFAPRNAAIYDNLANALIKAARFDQAVTALEAALALRPGYQCVLVPPGCA
jgi:tetratricopeptide (TPR) repeat protein